MEYQIQLDSFQGPLEVLYQLVKKNRIEISEISLAKVTQQYLTYIEQLKDFNLEVTSEFMIIAAELIQIKARTLLPGSDESEEDDDSNLVRRLKEYHYFKKVSQIFDEYQTKGSRLFDRPLSYKDIIGEDPEINFDIDLSHLMESYQKVLTAARHDGNEELDTKKEMQKIKFEEIKVEDKTEFIMNKLRHSKYPLPFEHFIEDKKNRMEVVVTFLSVLELARLSKIRLAEGKIVANIHLT
ncbi:MAG: segregation and condensation protein A [Halothermotrichaceae bacterium]